MVKIERRREVRRRPGRLSMGNSLKNWGLRGDMDVIREKILVCPVLSWFTHLRWRQILRVQPSFMLVYTEKCNCAKEIDCQKTE